MGFLWGVVLGGGYVGRHKNAGSWGVEGCGEQDPVKLRQRRVLCVCYACQAVCSREGGQPELLKCGGGAGFTVLSNDISILISLGVIVKCLPAARRGAKMLALCHVDYGFNFGIYISFLFEAHKSASSPRHTNAD